MARQGLGAIITGFAHVSRDGRAMQPGQAGMDSDDKVAAFREVTDAVHRDGARIFMQLAHAGRQTSHEASDGGICAPTRVKSFYFNHRPRLLDEAQIQRIVDCFAQAARRAREAGFDGVQLHAAHGYLIHQFIHPAINRLAGRYGIDPATGIGAAFLEDVFLAVRKACGTDFPVLVKISGGDRSGFGESLLIQLIRFLDRIKPDAIEISHGTMDEAFNIFRGRSIPVESILDYNPRFGSRNRIKRALLKALVFPLLKRQLNPFEPMYNLPHARVARRYTAIPLICVGGFRNGDHIRQAVETEGIDYVSLCRPILCEPDFALKLRRDEHCRSRCSSCNRCAVMCDSELPTRCFRPASPSIINYEY